MIFSDLCLCAMQVCLSILGTWRGESGEQWSSVQNIQSVMVSIQSLMDDQPYHNEPGFEKDALSETGCKRGCSSKKSLEEVRVRLFRYFNLNRLSVKNISMWVRNFEVPTWRPWLRTQVHGMSFRSRACSLHCDSCMMNWTVPLLPAALKQLLYSGQTCRQGHCSYFLQHTSHFDVVNRLSDKVCDDISCRSQVSTTARFSTRQCG